MTAYPHLLAPLDLGFVTLPNRAPVSYTHLDVYKRQGFMLDGHMAVAASSDGGILLRIDPAAAGDLVDGVVARRFEMRGRAMDGWLAVDPAAAQTDEALREWVAHGVAYVRSLPPK